MNELLEELVSIINSNYWIAPLVVFIGGIITSIMPCSISSIPLIIGYVSNVENKGRRYPFKVSLVFTLGMTITLTLLGTITALVGKIINMSFSWFYIILGIVMVIMGLQVLGVLNIIKPMNLASKNNKKGYIGALIMGMIGGIFSSPCATPILIAILTIVSTTGSILWGSFLLLLYSLGNSIFIIIIGTSTGVLKKIVSSKKYGRVSEILKYIAGILIVLFAFYLFYLGF